MNPLCPATLVRARFGLPIGPDAHAQRTRSLNQRAESLAQQLLALTHSGGVTLITGPSGSGKSMLIRALSSLIPNCVVASPISSRLRKPTIEVLRAPLDSRLRMLGLCGLADAHPLVTPAGLLSEGQKARLSIARAMDRARCTGKPGTVLIDEFCSTLDRTTAASVAASVRRAARPGIGIVAATAHDDLIEHLGPDHLVYLPLEGAPEILTRNDQ